VIGAVAWFDAVPAKAAGPQCESDKRWLFPTDLSTPDALQSYGPLVDTPALFRTFADTEPTEEGFLTFVNQYGMLGTGQPALMPGNQFLMGDSLSRMESEHKALTQVVHMLDALKSRRVEAAAQQVAHPIIDRALKTGRYSELREACVHWLKVTINERMGNIGPEKGDPLITVLELDASGNLRLQQKTRSLLGALWVQCARAAEGDQVFRRCKACRGWMLISPDVGKRRQAIYCSAVCKVRAFRSRARKVIDARGVARKRGVK